VAQHVSTPIIRSIQLHYQPLVLTLAHGGSSVFVRFTSLLLDVYVWLNMFPRLSSGAYNCISSLWFYRWRVVAAVLLIVLWPAGQTTTSVVAGRQRLTCIIPDAINTVYMLLMMSENIARNMYSNQETINYPTLLHHVGHFRILYLVVIF
jgi:hypothetical protein